MTDKYDTIISLLTQQNELLKQLVEAKPRSASNVYALWDAEQEEFLLDLYLGGGLSFEEIIPKIKEKFNIDRSPGALSARLRKLGIEMQGPAIPISTPIQDRSYNKAVF